MADVPPMIFQRFACEPLAQAGYVLVGLSRAVPGLFERIRWGEASVMVDTRSRLRAAGAR